MLLKYSTEVKIILYEENISPDNCKDDQALNI